MATILKSRPTASTPKSTGPRSAEGKASSCFNAFQTRRRGPRPHHPRRERSRPARYHSPILRRILPRGHRRNRTRGHARPLPLGKAPRRSPASRRHPGPHVQAGRSRARARRLPHRRLLRPQRPPQALPPQPGRPSRLVPRRKRAPPPGRAPFTPLESRPAGRRRTRSARRPARGRRVPRAGARSSTSARTAPRLQPPKSPPPAHRALPLLQLDGQNR